MVTPHFDCESASDRTDEALWVDGVVCKAGQLQSVLTIFRPSAIDPFSLSNLLFLVLWFP